MVRSIGLQSHGEGWEPVAKDWCGGEGILQFAECRRLRCVKTPWCCLLAEVCEGVGDVGVVVNEAAVEVGEPKERLDVPDVAGCWPCLDCRYFGWVHLEPLGR